MNFRKIKKLMVTAVLTLAFTVTSIGRTEIVKAQETLDKYETLYAGTLYMAEGEPFSPNNIMEVISAAGNPYTNIYTDYESPVITSKKSGNILYKCGRWGYVFDDTDFGDEDDIDDSADGEDTDDTYDEMTGWEMDYLYDDTINEETNNNNSDDDSYSGAVIQEPEWTLTETWYEKAHLIVEKRTKNLYKKEYDLDKIGVIWWNGTPDLLRDVRKEKTGYFIVENEKSNLADFAVINRGIKYGSTLKQVKKKYPSGIIGHYGDARTYWTARYYDKKGGGNIIQKGFILSSRNRVKGMVMCSFPSGYTYNETINVDYYEEEGTSS